MKLKYVKCTQFEDCNIPEPLYMAQNLDEILLELGVSKEHINYTQNYILRENSFDFVDPDEVFLEVDDYNYEVLPFKSVPTSKIIGIGSDGAHNISIYDYVYGPTTDYHAEKFQHLIEQFFLMDASELDTYFTDFDKISDKYGVEKFDPIELNHDLLTDRYYCLSGRHRTVLAFLLNIPRIVCRVNDVEYKYPRFTEVKTRFPYEFVLKERN